ncbi:hypothetical protein niasHT_009862 [Heterodera trifolii]|uniref:ABC transmembrane type-1 domain-containing protein n=1 Tax=Heterodera trifolii TaxID=157864 RepID=A0ABD2MDP0_9BILA
MCKNKKPDNSPKLNANFFSLLFYSWFGPIFKIGQKRPITENDLFELSTDNTNATSVREGISNFLTAQWEKQWLPAVEKYKERRRHQLSIWQTGKHCLKPKRSMNDECAVPMPSIVCSLLKLYKYELLAVGVVKLFTDILLFANPLLLDLLLDSVSDPNVHLCVCVNYHFNVMFQMGAKVQSLLTMAIYKKAFKMSNGTRRDKTVGEIVNLMAIDVERFQMIAPHIQQFWSSPFQIALFLVGLINLLGIAAIPGFLTMALILPLSFAFSSFTSGWLTTQTNLRDERAKLLSEILNGIKVIKLLVYMLNFTSPFLVAIGAFTTFILLDPAGGRSLTPKSVFVSLTLFNQIRSPMTMIGMLINLVVQTTVSNDRIREFLLEDELEKSEERKTPANVIAPLIRVISADFCWDNNGRNGMPKEGHRQPVF